MRMGRLRHCRQLARPLEGDFLGVLILDSGSKFASGRYQQMETNSGAPASFSSSLPTPSTRVWWLLEQDCESTITTSLLPFISQLCSKPASVILQLVVKRAFLGCFVVDVKRAFLGCFVVYVKQVFLGCFVVDVAIILFNKKGLVTFTW